MRRPPTAHHAFPLSGVCLLLSLLAVPASLPAQTCVLCGGTPLTVGMCPTPDIVHTGSGCSGLQLCQVPTFSEPSVTILPGGEEGTFIARLMVTVTAPWNEDFADSLPTATLDMTWFNVSPAPQPWTAGGNPSLCEYFQSDRVGTFVQVGGLSCDGAPYNLGTYALRAAMCGGPCAPPIFPNCAAIGWCGRWADKNGLDFVVTKSMLGCPEEPEPRKERCEDCKSCIATGGGCSQGVGGKGPACDLKLAADLYYTAEGAGNPGFPGSAEWTPALGRNWAHSYSSKIVVDPDDSHVWLIEKGIFREWSGLSAGVYSQVSPSSEKRRLTRTAGGWLLAELDGTTHTFNAAGLWTSTTDKNGNAKAATYNASNQLTAVSFSDGRTETFLYHPSGKLASLTEAGVGGSPTRAWIFSWTGDNLQRVDRPDGTAWEFFFDPSSGLLSRLDLVATDLSRRVEAAFSYDSHGNTVKSWRGDPSSTGPNAVEVYSYGYNNPALPTQTQTTDPFGKVTTYAIARDTVSDVPKITQISGDCPTCGVGPNAVFTYADPANPLLATQVVDGRGLITQHGFNSNGMTTSKTEAVGTPLARTTTWQYGNPTFPAFPTRIEVPSTSGGAAQRVTVLTYNATGDLVARSIQGAEAGSSFNLATTTAYNAAGQPLVIDPPGYAAADQTSFTYDPTRGNLLPLTRSDPLIGATQFGYDGLNRRTTTTDPNGVETVTAYDTLSRVTSVTQKGATPADDLVTTYTYNPFGDLLRTTLPRGNVIEYGYDTAGRLLSIERKLNASTPGERTLYAVDSYGHRTKEQLQRWNGAVWVTESFTDFVYSSRCHLDKQIHADGSVTEYAFDCDGNLERVWDAKHPRASNPTPTQLYQYDALNRMTSVTQPWAGAGGGTAVTSYAFDVQDHLSGVTDAEGNTTAFVHSDRDLMTQQVSPVSGTTTYTYNEHGELVAEVDARGVATGRSVDALDRVTAVAYPSSPALNILYTFDDPLVPFSKGRLTRISRNVAAIDYRYDRFGRVLQDGELTMSYDPNGNPVSLVYPGGVEAVSTYDFADRPASLLARRAGKPDQPLVTAASYLPSGPLASLALGNGLTETRAFNQRYFPASITLASGGNLLRWNYSTDAVGNILTIADALNAANNRTYGYLDHHYFLTQGNGPWGTRSWSYDKIGNRLSETRGAVTDTYSYLPSSGGGRSPILSQIQLGAGGTRTYQYGPAGHLEETATGADMTLFETDAAGRLSALARPTTKSDASFLYDGRDYLAFADPNDLPFFDGFESGNTCAWTLTAGGTTTPIFPPPAQEVRPTYSSEGLLHSLTRNVAPQRSHVFYFAGRPVAQLDLSGSVETWKYLTTDHLGTPIAATSTAGVLLWQGGFEPFGADWSSATGAGVFLRFPGQWREAAWETASLAPGLYQNVHRWYEAGTGRYTRPDPLGQLGESHPYLYAEARPSLFRDPLGMLSDDDLPHIPKPSCTNCSPHEKRIQQALRVVCGRTREPKCRNLLAEYGLLDCFRRRCRTAILVVCISKDGSCGGCGGPCNNVSDFTRRLFLQNSAFSSICGSLSNTLAHELGHMCGIGPDVRNPNNKRKAEAVGEACGGL